MSSVHDPSVLINQFIAAAASDGDYAVFASELASLLGDKSITLLQFIQGLGPSLTSDNTATRAHAVHCLSETLAVMVDKVALTRQDVLVLLSFLVSKLEDEKLTLHVLNGLTSLIKFKNFRPNVNDSLVSLLDGVNKHYDSRKHLARVRYCAFNLLDVLFTKHSDDICTNPAYTNLFVGTFVSIASGEKDPRNLLTSFKLNTLINKTVTFADRSEDSEHDRLLTELFDVCFCYFPISFTPPANDPYKITAGQLKTELRTTIASQPQFAQDSFPSLFEKLTSTNPAVRNDVLYCLFQCIQNYPANVIEQYWVTVWDALKFEILHNDVSIFKSEHDYIIPSDYESLEDTDDNKTLILTLKALEELAVKISETESFETMSSTIIGELKPHFKSLKEKTSKQAILLLCALGSSSPVFFNNTINSLFAFDVWGKFVRSDTQGLASEEDTEEEIDISLTVARQRDLIDYLGFVISTSKVLNAPNDLVNYKDHLLIFFGQLLQTSSNLEKTLKCKITQQLTKMALLDDFLSREEVTLILGWLSENMSNIIKDSARDDWSSDILLKEIVQALVKIMTESSEDMLQINVSSVIETVLPVLLSSDLNSSVLNLINQLCVNYHFLEVLSIRYLNKLAYDDYNPAVFGDLINSLIASFIQTQAAKPFLTNSWYQNFVPRFLSIMFKRCNDDPYLLEISGKLIGYVIRFIEQSKHQAILNELVPLFLGTGSFGGMTLDSVADSSTPKLTVFKNILAKIDRRVSFPVDTQELISKFVELLSSLNEPLERVWYLQALAVLVNKFAAPNDENVARLVEDLYNAEDLGSLESSIWLIKGLVVRNDAIGMSFLKKTIEQLSSNNDTAKCRVLSNSFNIIMSDLDIFTNEENSKVKIISGVMNLNVKLLYKQQIFQTLLMSLIAEFVATENEEKREIYLNTLAITINNVSKDIIKPHLKEILPMVLSGLTSQNTSVLNASLQTFKVIIGESPDLIQENVSSLTAKLLDLATKKIVVGKKLVNDENIRLLSLECIAGIFTNLELSKVVKYRNSTRSRLEAGLDDKKRVVRKKATDVIQILHELGR